MPDKFLEQLKRKQAAAEGAQSPETPEETPSLADPEARAALLEDQLTNTREELEAERQQRQKLQRRLEAQAQPKTLSDVLRAKQAGKGRTWR